MATDDTTHRGRIEEIADVERSGDELVTLAVPPDREIETVRREIEEDHAESEYLDETVAQPAQQALESVRRTLRDYESIPDGGLVIYADAGEAVFVFDDLPGTVEEFVYARNNEFDTAPGPISPNPEGATGCSSSSAAGRRSAGSTPAGSPTSRPSTAR